MKSKEKSKGCSIYCKDRRTEHKCQCGGFLFHTLMSLELPWCFIIFIHKYKYINIDKFARNVILIVK